jgi:hypothetical protein
MVRELTIGATLGLGALALAGAVVAWRLAGSYRADVGTLCAAETRSGLTLARDMPALGEWLRGHLTTPDGNTLLSRLGDVPVAERASRLREAAASLGIAPCPMAESYAALGVDADYRADLQRLCSYVTFPGLADVDDEARLDAIEAWIEGTSANARTRDLAGPLRSAETPAERATILRRASRAMDIYTCDLAKLLESPPPLDGEREQEGGEGGR